MNKLVVSFGGPSPAVISKVSRGTWPQFAGWLTREQPEVEDKAARGWYIPAEFDPAYRDSENFVARSALTFDFDKVPQDAWAHVQKAWAMHAFAMYTTFSHTEEAWRFRVVMPLSRPVGYDEFQAISRKMASIVGIELLARESFVPAQMMYAPTRRAGAIYRVLVNEGEILNADTVLAAYADWTDRAQWPHRADGDGVHARGDSQSPPSEKPGVVGDFCRAFDIPAAIQRFDLPYEPTAAEGRWTYTAGSRPEGAILYDDGQKLHSHHDTDPARGQSNSFDLVRAHRFADLDSEEAKLLPVTERPSYKAMARLAREQPELQQAVAADFDDLGPLPTVVEEVEVKKDGTEVTRFKVQRAEEFSGGKPMDWIVRGVLPRAELCVLYGESGSGKSFLALDLAAAITRGLGWRGKRTTAGRVVYVCAEGAGGFKARLRAYAAGHGCELHTLPAVIPDTPNLLEASDASALTRGILEWGRPDVVIVDTLSATAAGGNENSGEDMGRVLSHCKKIHKATGALIVLIHHSGKDATKGARGWSGLRAAADAEIEVTRNGDYRSATVTKMKDGGDGASWPFKLQIVNLGVDLDGEEESSCIIEHTEERDPNGDSHQKPQGAIQIVLFKVLQEECAGGGAIEWEHVRAEAKERLGAPAEGETDRRSSILARARDGLVARGLMYAHDTKVSLTPIKEGTEKSWES